MHRPIMRRRLLAICRESGGLRLQAPGALAPCQHSGASRRYLVLLPGADRSVIVPAQVIVGAEAVNLELNLVGPCVGSIRRLE